MECPKCKNKNLDDCEEGKTTWCFICDYIFIKINGKLKVFALPISE